MTTASAKTGHAFDITGDLPEGTTLIEASAGTGKTWTVAALVTRYVVEEGVPLSELLVVTFSRAASQELRERVRDMLDHVLRRLEAPAAGDDDALVAHLRDAPAEQVELRRARLRAALADFDTATIATIHQFCQYVLRGLGVAGDSDSFATLSEDMWQLREDVISDTFLARQDENGSFGMPFHEARADAWTALEHSTTKLSPLPPPQALEQRVRFVEDVRTQYRRRKKRASVIEYDDLLSELATALHSSDSAARTRMRERWSVVLVDEFQDTDPVQWDVFATAFGDGGIALVLIGDPKQAIYGFRGGDVQTYLRAAKSASSRLSLPTNYRSDAPLVDALGVVLGDVQLSDGIVARPISAAHPGSRVDGLGETAVDLRYVLDEPMPVGAARAIAARDAAAEIAELLSSGALFDGRALTPRDIAVLARRGADLIAVRTELRRLGIPAVLVSSESVLHTEAASWWLQLLMAMEQPHRSERVRAAALTPFLGWSAAELDEAGERGTETIAATVRAFVAAFARGGVAAILDVARTQGLTARLLGRVGGERDLTDVEHCAQLLGERAVAGTSGLPSLTAWLRERNSEDTRTTADTRVMRLESDALAVTLSTIHGSKGLQYPIVLTPFLWDNWVKASSTPAVLHTDDGRVLSFDPRQVGRPEHRAEALDEDLRLAYVAMTRAQCRLVLWWLPAKHNTLTSGLHRMLFGQATSPDELNLLLEERDAVRTAAADGDAAAVAHSASSERQPTVLRETQGFQPAESIEAMFATWQAAGAFRAALITPRPDVRPPEFEASTEPLTGSRFDADHLVDAAWRRTSYSALVAAGEAAASGTEPEAPDVGRQDEVDIVISAADQAGVEPAATASHETDSPMVAATTLASPMAELPMGATFGSLVHAALEEADFQAPDLLREFMTHVEHQRLQWPVELPTESLAEALVAVCETPLGALAGEVRLRDIASADRLPEMEFELPMAGGDSPRTHATLRALAAVLREHLPPGDPILPYATELENPGLGDQPLRGYLTGSIDLTFRHDGRFYVVDYKTNRLGDPDRDLTLADYAPERLVEAMNHSSYPLQALLYAVVLHRYLRWRLPNYRPQEHLGGVLYLYVRGMAGPETPRFDDVPCGVFAWQPPAALVEALSDVLDGAAHPEETTR